ncbi:NAD(P)/FAD-dependent oxidoreductase [Sphingomonas sp.]|jgi:cation diffusion facilitator CzcD-associated flavoprotein CzcO|uniref:flavin-containing monooxygenase n=1 Tax=Sphingomonas sp. TaxID=28214 RepID=UPI002ED89CB6
MTEHFDVIVVGAGISGVGAAYHLQAYSPDRSYLVLEGRERMGGTWDLFRYPGIRSDSDMYTLGFSFKPWTEAKAIADGPSILNYLEETAREFGIDKHIRYSHRLSRAEWSSEDARWTVTVDWDGEEVRLTCGFLFMCTGYYNYAEGFTPEFAGSANFGGRIVHPQFWTPDIDYAGKRVVVIGSGATAVTLVPELAKQAAHVTMLQRSPTYIVSLPSEDGIANWLRRVLPAKTAYAITRWKNVLRQQFLFNIIRKRPEKTKERLIGMVRDELGPDYDVGTHFTPKYNPWDQRLCLVPDADLFGAIRSGKADVATDTIDHFTADGIVLTSGKHLPADLVVTATGLKIQLMSDVPFLVDGKPVSWSARTMYKGMMFSDVPNMAMSFGYTNASWTLKSDLTGRYVTRLLNAMRQRGMRQVTPRIQGAVEPMPFLDFTSGYVQRAIGDLPRQGTRKPWRLNQNYTRDIMALRFGGIDQEMEFSNPEPRPAKAA